MSSDEQKKIRSKLDIEQYIMKLLNNGQKYTTNEIVKLVEAGGLSCPDEPVRFLNKMKMKDQIKGKLSMEHKGWIWWIDK